MPGRSGLIGGCLLVLVACRQDQALSIEDNLSLLATEMTALPLACGRPQQADPAVTVVLSAELCFSCTNIGRVLREIRSNGEAAKVAVATLTTDTASVCSHLRREGLSEVPVFSISPATWKAKWPPYDLWVALPDSMGRYAEFRLARRARAALFQP